MPRELIKLKPYRFPITAYGLFISWWASKTHTGYAEVEPCFCHGEGERRGIEKRQSKACREEAGWFV